ncbi:MAG: hypothetical protein ABIO81_12625 [Ginsengibacter sp.]
MKTVYTLAILFALFIFKANGQNVSINTTGAVANASAMLDISSDKKGILVPRVNLTSTLDITTIPAPAISLLVYNTATAGTSPNNVVPGFYFWQTNKWNQLARQTGIGILAFAEFYAVMPPNNPGPVFPGAFVEFPNAGPNSGNGIVAANPNTFILSDIGTYMVSWTVSVNEPGQLALSLNGIIVPYSVSGRSAGSTQITGNAIISAPAANSILRVFNPPGNSTPLTITPFAGGNNPVAATLIITRIK